MANPGQKGLASQGRATALRRRPLDERGSACPLRPRTSCATWRTSIAGPTARLLTRRARRIGRGDAGIPQPCSPQCGPMRSDISTVTTSCSGLFGARWSFAMSRSHALGSDWPRCAHSAVETRLRSNGATCWSASTACLGRQVHRPGDQLASSCVAPAAATPLAACSTAQPPCGDAQRSSAHRRLAEMQEKFVLSCKRGEPGRLNAARRLEIHMKKRMHI